MERMLIGNLKGGEILAQGVCDEKGVQLLAAGSTYKKSYSKILQALEIACLHIRTGKNPTLKKEFDPQRLKEESKHLITTQLERFEKVASINIYKFERFIFTIMEELLESLHILENLYIVQDYNHHTYEHSVRVTVIAILICNQMNLSRYKTYEIAMGCMLHDLGKTQVCDTILNKPAKLTKEEFDKIKQHPYKGYEFIKNKKGLSPVIKNIILGHHEKLDGSGYPLGLKDEEICMEARICAVADIFDAMCSERPYKKAGPLPESLRIMKTTMNKQLDMNICQVLENILEENI